MRTGMLSLFVGILVIISLSSSNLNNIKPGFEGYKHFTGTLDTNMRITFDLFSQNGTIEGYYYYGFPVPGEESYFQFGKTMAVEGIIEGEKFRIHEKINPESRFTGTFDGDGTMQGKWARQTYQKEVRFNLSENYGNGSIPMEVYQHYDYHYVVQNNVTSKDMPKAEMDILMLFPQTGNNKMLRDTFNLYVSEFAMDTNITYSTPRRLMNAMTADFFNAYQTTTEGIPNIELLSSFNWQKRFSSEVLYNDNNILSIRMEKYAYTGGAHGVAIQGNLVFDLLKNKRIRLNDLFYDGFEPRLNALIDKKLRKLNGIAKDDNLNDAGFLIDEIEINNNFYINNDGIVFYYNVYEIAPYASGPLEISIPFYEIRGLLKNPGTVQWIDL